MILSEVFLVELRRNPEVNTKTSLSAALAPFQNREDVFVSFVNDVGQKSHANTYSWWDKKSQKPRNASGLKIGVNPSTEFFSTPGGVYVYPIKEMWDAIVTGTLPYAGYAPFIYVLESTGPVLDLAHYANEDLSRDLAKLGPMIERLSAHNGAMSPDEMIEMWTGRARSPGEKFWSAVKGIAQFESGRRTRDKGHAGLAAMQRSEKSQPWVWNGILRALGYSAFIDRKGERIIHVNEPIQAVFLKPDAFRTLDVLRNPFAPKEPRPKKPKDGNAGR